MKKLFLIAVLAVLFPAIVRAEVLQVSDTVAVSVAARTPRISKNSLKLTILSLGSGATKLTYERAITPHLAAEVTAGRIGWGWDWLNHTQYSKGAMGKVAVIYTFWPQPKTSGTWLAGMYAKPEFMYTNFNYMQREEDFQRHTSEFALMGKLGYQLVLKWFVFDAFAGCGYAWGTGNANDYFHGFLFYGGIQHLAISMGFRIGVAF